MQNTVQNTDAHSPLPNCPKCGENRYERGSTFSMPGRNTDIGYKCTGCEGEFLFTHFPRTGGLFFFLKEPDGASFGDMSAFRKSFSQEQLPAVPPIPDTLTVFHESADGVWTQLIS